MRSEGVIVSLISDENGRIIHLHDLNSRVTISYIDDHAKGLIDIEDHGQRNVVTHVTELLEDVSIECYEFRPNPNGQNLKIFCKDNLTHDYIVYTVVGAQGEVIYNDSQPNLTPTNTDGD